VARGSLVPFPPGTYWLRRFANPVRARRSRTGPPLPHDAAGIALHGASEWRRLAVERFGIDLDLDLDLDLDRR